MGLFGIARRKTVTNLINIKEVKMFLDWIQIWLFWECSPNLKFVNDFKFCHFEPLRCLLSIWPTFHEQVFHTEFIWAAFQFRFVLFGRENWQEKLPLKVVKTDSEHCNFKICHLTYILLSNLFYVLRTYSATNLKM